MNNWYDFHESCAVHLINQLEFPFDVDRGSRQPASPSEKLVTDRVRNGSIDSQMGSALTTSQDTDGD